MLFKEDWLRATEKFSAWWEHETEKPIIQVTAPKKGYDKIPRWTNWQFARNQTNPTSCIDEYEKRCSKVFYGGEAYPDLWINLGPGILAAYLGATPRYRQDSQTVWFETPKSWEELEQKQFMSNNEWWQQTKNLTSLVTEKSRGKFMNGITDLGGITDTVASLRGSQKLITDMFTRPEKVIQFSNYILDIWHFCYDELYNLSEGVARGNSSWMGIWSAKKWYPIQCDFAALLSPKLFNELALPFIEEQCLRLKHVVFHLDGPGAIPHLDELLKIQELDGIQWVPRTGDQPADSPEWFRLYRKIRGKGKLLVLTNVKSERVKSLIRILGPKKLLLRTRCRTENEARELVNRYC